MATKFAVETIFKAVDKVSGPLTRMTSSVNRFADRAESSLGRVNKSLNSTSGAITSGIKATTAAAAASGAALAKVTQTGADFEQQITNAAAKFPGEIRKGTKAFAQLEAAAREIGATTEFSASQAAGAIDFLAMAGFNAEQSVGALPEIVDLATAANLDLATAADIASDALGQFNMTSEDAGEQTKNLARIMDVMVRTATTANVTVDGLFETYKQAAPVATAAGQSIETLNALTGTLANSGIKASQAGTALRAVFGRLQAPTGKAADAIGQLGIQTRDSEGNMLDVIDILGQMGTALDGFGTSQRAEVLKAVFGEEPIAAVNVLLAAGSKELNQYRGQLEQASGASRKLATVMRDTTRADINGMNSAIEGLTITLFDLNKDGIRETLGGFTRWVRTISQTLQSNEALGKSIGQDVLNAVINLGKAILVLVGAVVALKVASIATSAAILAVKTAGVLATASISAWATATAAMPAILATARAAILAFNIALAVNPIGVIIGSITALAATAALLIANWGSVTSFFAGLWDGIKGAFVAAIDGIMTVVNPFVEVANSVSSVWDKLRGTVSEPIEAEINTRQNIARQVTTGQNTIATAGDGVISPQESIVRSINENKSSAEVTLRNETDARAEVSQQRGPMNLQIANSGAF
jgi:TP901 family phage tail tape measure protein